MKSWGFRSDEQRPSSTKSLARRRIRAPTIPAIQQGGHVYRGRCLWLAAIAVGTVSSAVGCGVDGQGAVPVSGRVTLDGVPQQNLQITFQPISKDESGFGPGSFGRTDAEGRFEMRKVWPDAPGAIPGTHRVTMSFDMDPVAKSLALPEKYRTGKATFEVPPEGTRQANFDLTSSK